MTKRIKLELTEDQLNQIWRVLEWAYYEDSTDPDEKRHNAYIRRLRNKIAKSLYGDRAKQD